MTNEPLSECPVPDTLLVQLLTLASTPFRRDQHQQLWQAFEWPYSPSREDGYGIRLEFQSGSLVVIQPHGDTVGCYSVPVCYWETYDRPAAPLYSTERARYGAAYAQLYQQVHSALGEPFLRGTDPDSGHAYAIWQTQHALVIVQQAAFDLQFGIEVNLWLEQFSGSLTAPTAPLIDWLTARDQARDRA